MESRVINPTPWLEHFGLNHAESLIPLWSEDGAKPACTLLEVAGLFHPALMVEIEAVAVA